MAEKTAAEVVVHYPNEMTVETRKEIADWLRWSASFLESDGDRFSEVFSTRYFYKENGDAVTELTYG